MRRPHSIFPIIACGVAILVAAAATAQPRPTTIPVQEIRPGMRGFGLTVFRGTATERFDVEVIDVLHNFRPDQDLILVRTDHPILQNASTVAGMSGSPIYFDGRLAGAYAYGWPFGKDPIAGVTPIANMLAEMDRPVEPEMFPGSEPLGRLSAPAPRSRARALERGTAPIGSRLGGVPPFAGRARRSAFDPLAEYTARMRPRSDSGPTGLVPASTPLMLGGLTEDVSRFLGDSLAPFGLVTVQAGAGGESPRRDEPRGFEAGGPIGVQLIRGDISATAIGTVTHVGARRVLAFGHPMMNAGQIGLPTATAKVLHVLASYNRSFKIAEAQAPLGTMVHDRQPTIVVDSDLEATTIPVQIRLRGVPAAPRTEWRVEIAAHRVLSPVLTVTALANALQATVADQTDVVFTAKTRVGIAGQGTVEVEDRGYLPNGAVDPRLLGSLRVFDLMDAAFGNPFLESRVTGVEIDLSLKYERSLVEILGAAVSGDEVDPGRTVPIYVRTRRFGEPEKLRVVPLRIPERLAGETVEVEITSGTAVNLELPEPRSLDDMIRGITSGYPSTAMVVSMKMPSRGLRFRGQVVRALPGSALDSLQLKHDSGDAQPFVTRERQVIEGDAVLVGSAKLELKVRPRPER